MAHINYGTIVLLMAIESSFLPLPSEVVIPPAAWKAAQGELNLMLVIIAGTIGSLIGALFNYYLALFLGRKVIYALADTRLIHAMGIDRKHVEKAEKFFIKYGKSSTFIGRLVPGVRHLISIPAGLAKMNMKDFMFYTVLGAFIWDVILAVLGYFLYSQKEVLERYYQEISYFFVILVVVLLLYAAIKFFFKPKNSNSSKVQG